MKQVQIILPYEKTEAVFTFLLDVVHAENILKLNADNAHILQFRVDDDYVMETVEKLKSNGVGVEFGVVDVLDLRASLPREKEETHEKTIHREAAIAVEEIFERVDRGSALSFDFFAFAILADAICALGLIQDNGTLILAGMLLCPLMGPLLALALGYVVSDRGLLFKGVKNELIALAVALLFGLLVGGLAVATSPGFVTSVRDGRNIEMTRATGFVGIDVVVAILAGAAVAISITRGDVASLVGVAISTSLMPPAVNTGMCVAIALGTQAPEVISLASGSFQLLLMNIVAIDFAAVIMLKVKKLSPIKDRSAHWTAVTTFKSSSLAGLYHVRQSTPATTTGQPTESPFPESRKDESNT